MELTKKELLRVNGGGGIGLKIGICAGAIISFIIGFIDGYKRPLKCNK